MNFLSPAIDALETEIARSNSTTENHLYTAKNLEIRIRTEVTDNCVAIRIADSGPGISEPVFHY